MQKLPKELMEHIVLKSFVTSRSINGPNGALEQEQRIEDEYGFSSTSTQVTTNYQTVTLIHDQTTYIVLSSVCADWRRVLIPVTQANLLNMASRRSNTALAKSDLGQSLLVYSV